MHGVTGAPAGAPVTAVTELKELFPTEYLGRDEQLIMSRKPKLTAFLFPPAALMVIVGIVLTVIGYAALLSLLTPGASSLSGGFLDVFLFFLLPFIGWILVLVGTYRWRVVTGVGFAAIFLLLQIIVYPLVAYYLFLPSVINGGSFVTLIEEELALIVVLYLLVGVIIPMPIAYMAWKKTFYGITNKRTLKVFGIINKNSRDAPHDKMQDVTMSQPLFGRLFGWGDITFATAASAGGSGSGWRREREGLGIFWYGIANPVNTRTEVHEIVEAAKQALKVQEFQQMAQVFRSTGQPMPGVVPGVPATSPGDTRFCSACGTPNSAAAQFCSKCGATMPK